MRGLVLAVVGTAAGFLAVQTGALPMRPNGTTGWVVHGALGSLHRVRTWLVIDRARLRAKFYKRNRVLWSAPVGIGKPSTPTPTGLYWVREEFVLANQAFYG